MSRRMNYRDAGVDIDATDAAKRDMAGHIDVGDARILNRVGAFASLVDGRFPGVDDPVLVFKTDEPGSKQKLAFEMDRIESLAQDLVNHLINDVIVMGAAPVYMQDCIVCGRLDADTVTRIVQGMSEACRVQGCALVGGETSVQPDVVADGLYVLSASAIGVVDRARILDGSAIAAGDAVLAIASNGLHTNGYTMVRRLLAHDPGLAERRVDGEPFLEVVMRPHTCYYRPLQGFFGHPGLHGLAHITGGGVRDNLVRILPEGLRAVVDVGRFRVPTVFGVIREVGDVDDADMARTFNLGVGMAVVCAADAAHDVIAHLAGQGHEAYPIGAIEAGARDVELRGAVRWPG